MTEKELKKAKKLFGQALAQAFIEKFDEELAEEQGIELTPGDPERCKGNGKHPGIECCCDECDYYTKCFPEWAPGGSAWKEDNENAGN